MKCIEDLGAEELMRHDARSTEEGTQQPASLSSYPFIYPHQKLPQLYILPVSSICKYFLMVCQKKEISSGQKETADILPGQIKEKRLKWWAWKTYG